MTCTVCLGSGSILARQWPVEFWNCPKCGGAGVSVQHGPVYINNKQRRKAIGETTP